MDHICLKLAEIYANKSLNSNDLQRDMLNFLEINRVIKRRNNIFILIENKVNVLNFSTKIVMDHEKDTLVMSSIKCVLYDTDSFIIPICSNTENVLTKIKVKDQLKNVKEVVKGVREWRVRTDTRIKGGSVAKVLMKFKNLDDRVCYFCELDKSVQVRIRDEEGKKISMYILPNVMLDGNVIMVREEKVKNGEVNFRVRNCNRGFAYIFK